MNLKNNTLIKKINTVLPKIIPKINIVDLVYDHLLGKNHKEVHRVFTGIILMATGVTIAQFGSVVTVVIVHYSLDMIGYFIHGLGTIPIIEIFKKKK